MRLIPLVSISLAPNDKTDFIEGKFKNVKFAKVRPDLPKFRQNLAKKGVHNLCGKKLLLETILDVPCRLVSNIFR